MLIKNDIFSKKKFIFEYIFWHKSEKMFVWSAKLAVYQKKLNQINMFIIYSKQLEDKIEHLLGSAVDKPKDLFKLKKIVKFKQPFLSVYTFSW